MVGLHHSSGDIACCLPTPNTSFMDAPNTGANGTPSVPGLLTIRTAPHASSSARTQAKLPLASQSAIKVKANTQQHVNQQLSVSVQQHVNVTSAAPFLSTPCTVKAQQYAQDQQADSLQDQCAVPSHPVASNSAQPCDSFDTDASCSLDSDRTSDIESSSSNVVGASDCGGSSSQIIIGDGASACSGQDDGRSWFGAPTVSRTCKLVGQTSIPARSARVANDTALHSSVSSHSRAPRVPSAAQFNSSQSCLQPTFLPSRCSSQPFSTSIDKQSCASQPDSFIPCLGAIAQASGSHSGCSGTPTIAATLAHSQQLQGANATSTGSPLQASQTTIKPPKQRHPRASLQLPEAKHLSIARRSEDVSDGGRRTAGRSTSIVRGSTLFCLLHTGSSDIRQPGSAFPPVRGINQSWSGCEPGMTVTGFDTQTSSRSFMSLPSFRPAASAAVDIISNACIFGSSSNEPWVPMQALSEVLADGTITANTPSNSGSTSDGSSTNGSGGLSSARDTRTTLASTTNSSNSDISFSSSADEDSPCKEAPVYTAVKHYAAVVSTLPALPAISEHQSHHHHHHHHYHLQADSHNSDPLAQQAQQQQAELASELHAAHLKGQHPHHHHRLNQPNIPKQPHTAARSETSLGSDSSLALSLESAVSVSTHVPLPSLSDSLNHSNGQLCSMSEGQHTLSIAQFARSSAQVGSLSSQPVMSRGQNSFSSGQLQLSSGQVTALSSTLYSSQQQVPAKGRITQEGQVCPSNSVAAAANGTAASSSHAAAVLSAATARHTLDWTRQMQAWRTVDRKSADRGVPTTSYLSAATGQATTTVAARASTDSVINVLSFADMGQLSTAVTPASNISWPQQMSAWLRSAGDESYGTDPRTQWWGVSGFFSELRTKRLSAKTAATASTDLKSSPEVRTEVYCTLEQAMYAIDDERSQRQGQASGWEWQWPARVNA